MSSFLPTARRPRRLALLAVLLVLLVGAGFGVWRSVTAEPADPATRIAEGLRCPACQGESVADSHSPVAAAMRQTIADQLDDGRDAAQIRQWFVDRYGPDVLAQPPAHGVNLVLWVVPGVALAGVALLALRTVRRRPPRDPREADRDGTDPDDASQNSATRDRARATGRRRDPRNATPATSTRARWAWNLTAVALAAMVVLVAVAGVRLSGRETEQPTASSADPVTTQLTIASSLEAQGQYDAAAEIYQKAVQQRPDDAIRLRLAYALLRANRPAEAEQVAQQLRAADPTNADALLLLGLAQRAQNSPDADATLQQFLELAPDHPAAAQVQQLLK